MKYARNNSLSRFVPIILVVLITIVAVAAVIAIGRSLTGGDQRQDQQAQVDIGRESLLATDAARAVRITVRGSIVAQEKHRSYRVTVSPDRRQMVTHEGYLDAQLEEKTFDNNAAAYTEFVYALEKRKMMESRKISEEQDDLRGICASGRVYKFETLLNGEPVKTVWTSDCSGSKGSAVANVNEIVQIFLKQIPDGKKMASEVGLSQQDTLFKL